jgi:hypothetical protein
VRKRWGTRTELFELFIPLGGSQAIDTSGC